MWSALILLIVVGSVLTGMDTAAVSSALSRSRVTAASLAEQDQERLRSYRAVDLSNRVEKRTVSLGGVTYTVTSEVKWIRDSDSTPLSCTSGSSQADYMLIGSTVTSGTLTKQRAVHIESLLAPPLGSFGPTQGTLGVQVVDRAGAPVNDMTVSLPGSDSLPLATNSLGCAMFGYIPAASYSVTLDKPDWVDAGGVGRVTKSATVSAGTVSSVTMQYDRSADIHVTFDTAVAGTVRPSSAKALTAANSGVPPSGVRRFATSTFAGAIDATDLFPFASDYTLYAGDCASANPQTYVPTYFASRSGVVTTAPGGSYTAAVRLPAINVVVTRAGLPLQGARVVMTPTGTGCTGKTAVTTGSAGTLGDPGVPFGTYTVCADFGSRRVTLASVVQNVSALGTATIPLSLPTNATSGTCP